MKIHLSNTDNPTEFKPYMKNQNFENILKIIIILIIFIKDKPVKKQKLEHGKHAAQDQEKENGF